MKALEAQPSHQAGFAHLVRDWLSPPLRPGPGRKVLRKCRRHWHDPGVRVNRQTSSPDLSRPLSSGRELGGRFSKSPESSPGSLKVTSVRPGPGVSGEDAPRPARRSGIAAPDSVAAPPPCGHRHARLGAIAGCRGRGGGSLSPGASPRAQSFALPLPPPAPPQRRPGFGTAPGTDGPGPQDLLPEPSRLSRAGPGGLKSAPSPAASCPRARRERPLSRLRCFAADSRSGGGGAPGS